MMLGFALLATLQAGKVWSGNAAQPSWSPKAAAKYLDGRADEWLNCLSFAQISVLVSTSNQARQQTYG
jgi:hypothetical protein